MSLVVSTSTTQSLEIRTAKARRLVAVVLSLLGQIDAIEQGKLTLSWSAEANAIKWCVESYGREGIDTTLSTN